MMDEILHIMFTIGMVGVPALIALTIDTRK